MTRARRDIPQTRRTQNGNTAAPALSREGTEDTVPDAKVAPITAYVVPHTHWDREWYRPFQIFRARLLEVIDRVLQILGEDPGYRRFTLDGQAIVLEDYLALRPENRVLVERQVRAGRLRIGPWYVLADEFLVSPEALVRNLLLGQRLCREFGPTMPVGYTPDSFGHISQLPLIARGFGLDSIVFERGVGDEGERLRGEFRWLAADGHTDIFAVHLLGTYSAAAALGHADWELGDAYDGPYAIDQMRAVLFGPHDSADRLPAWLRESFERLPEGIVPYNTHGAVLLLNGSDHLFPVPNLPTIVSELNDAFPNVHFVHGDIEEFVSAARTPLEQLEVHQGEFRGSRYQHVLSGVLSSRIYLKQANHHAETLLERFAEPLATLAWLEGRPYPYHLLWEAWRLLLQNHPHDSICGCSVDPVHDEMMVRFAGVTQLGETVASQALETLAGAPGMQALAVFNPLPYPRRATITHTLDLPPGLGRSLGVEDEDGNPVPSQANVEEVFAPGRSDRTVDRTTVRFAGSLPALGLQGYRLVENASQNEHTELRAAEQTDGIILENAWVRLETAIDGQMVLTDKETGLSRSLDLHLEDVADAGDEYDFSPLAGDAPIRISTPRKAPALVEQGPVSATVRLEYVGAVPERLRADRTRREGSVAMPITVDLSLDATGPLVRVTVTVDNQAEDHRLRLRLRTGCATDHVWADGHYDVLKRAVRPPDGAGWFQAPRATSHQRRFVAVSDGERGLAVLNRGLPEYEAIPGDRGVDLAVTLLRCVGWLSREDLTSRPQGAGPSLPTPGGQCPGVHTFELALMPLSGARDEGAFLYEVQAFAAPARAWQTAEAPRRKSWLELHQPPRAHRIEARRGARQPDRADHQPEHPGGARHARPVGAAPSRVPREPRRGATGGPGARPDRHRPRHEPEGSQDVGDRSRGTEGGELNRQARPSGRYRPHPHVRLHGGNACSLDRTGSFSP